MKVSKLERQQNKAFTLIEMIGVLAVIAILAALLIPKVFQAITEAKINTVPVGVATCKTAVVDHYAKYGALNTLRDTAIVATSLPMTNYDQQVLMVEGFLDKSFAPRVGTNAHIVLAAIASPAPVLSGSEGTAYCLSGSGNTNEVTGSHVVYAEIDGVTPADAQAISARIDGAALSQAEGTTGADLLGRVKYAAAASAGDTVNVYVYMTHR